MIKSFHHDVGIQISYYHQRKLWHRTTAQATTTVVVIDLHVRKPLINVYRVPSILDGRQNPVLSEDFRYLETTRISWANL